MLSMPVPFIMLSMPVPFIMLSMPAPFIMLPVPLPLIMLSFAEPIIGMEVAGLDGMVVPLASVALTPRPIVNAIAPTALRMILRLMVSRLPLSISRWSGHVENVWRRGADHTVSGAGATGVRCGAIVMVAKGAR